MMQAEQSSIRAINTIIKQLGLNAVLVSRTFAMTAAYHILGETDIKPSKKDIEEAKDIFIGN